MTQKHIAIVEATTSGAGLEILKSALKNNYKVTFIVRDLAKYYRFDKENIFEHIDIIHCDTNSEEELERNIIKLNDISTIDGVLTLTDGRMEIVSRIAKKMGLPCTNPEAVRKARNKDCTREVCKDLGIKIPQYKVAISSQSACDFAEVVGYPVIVKSSKGTGSSNVELCKNKVELVSSYNKIEDRTAHLNNKILVEEFLVGPLVSVEAVSMNGEMNILGFTNRLLGPLPYFVEVGYSFPINFNKELEYQLISNTKQVLKSLEIDNGATHTEFIITKDGPALVEVNPRLGGGMLGPMISESLNIDLYEVLIKIAIGEQPVLETQPTKGCSTKVIYSNKNGVVNSIDKTIALQCPGVKDVFLSTKKGDNVTPPEDFKGEIGFVWAEGPTVELATSNCQTAANCVLVDID